MPRFGDLRPTVANARHCRSICGEMLGICLAALSLPMNIQGALSRLQGCGRAAKTDIERITTIWHECLRSMAGLRCSASDCGGRTAMFAP